MSGSISDAVRILLTRVARGGALPAGLAVDPDAYDAWFRAKVQEALADNRPATPHSKVTAEAQALIAEEPCPVPLLSGGRRLGTTCWRDLIGERPTGSQVGHRSARSQQRYGSRLSCRAPAPLLR